MNDLLGKDILICPYCDYEFNNFKYNDYLPGESYSIKCPDCEQNIIIKYVLVPQYYSLYAPCLNGGEHEYMEIPKQIKEYYIYIKICKYCGKEKKI